SPPEAPRPPVVIAGVEDEIPPAVVAPVANAATPPAGVLPNTGASDLTELLGAGGLALVMVGGMTLWLRRRFGLDS
ncbi:MAG TPA: LPXTG cell wall anchor domain-containing protein, partial [Nocardioidaceae bacterium]|nr:LPXTG cell wall anchor domain-containing protein [Nocardioidaceae bacterium]